MRITLCLLTFNELQGCRHDVPQIDRTQFDEIYAVDAGSTDGTVEYLKKENIPVYTQPKKGLNAACVYGFEKCGSDALIFFHPKGSVPVADTLKFRQFFDAGYELVIASRMVAGGKNEEDSQLFKPRKWFVLSLGIAAALLFKREGHRVRDVLHGFRGATKAAFEKMAPCDWGVSIDIEMVSRSYKKRLRRIEFPTQESARIAGQTHFKAIPTGAKLLKYLINEIFRKD